MVIQGIKLKSYLFLYQMPKIEKRVKKTKQKTGSIWYQLAILAEKEMAGQVIGK